MGIDFGIKKIGVAISDEMKEFAFPYKILKISSYQEGVEKIIEIVSQKNVDEIVVGIPYNLKGKDTLSTKQAKKFIKLLRKSLPIPVSGIDERMTTAMSHRISDRREDDHISAYIILSDYLKRKK